MNLRTNAIVSSAILGSMLAASSVSQANLLVNPSFETIEPVSATAGLLPSTLGDWQGDMSQIVTTQQGIVPHHLNQMLHFQATNPTGPGGTVASQVWQLIDVSSGAPAAMIATGNAIGLSNYWVNRIQFDNQTDTSFGLILGAYSGSPANFPTNFGTPLAQVSAGLATNGNPQDWEQITNLPLSIPIGTTYLALQIHANENVFNDSTNPEYDGHYADLAFVDVAVPEPTTIGALALVAGSLLMRRPRRERSRD